MRRAWMAFALALLATSAWPLAARDLTESEVGAVVDRIDRAAQARDVEEIASLLSERVAIRGSMVAGEQVQRFAFGKAEYLQALRDTWAATPEYRYRRSNVRIALAGPVAMVTSDVVEAATVAGGTLRTRASETMTVERIDGAVQVTRIVADGTVSGEPL